MGTVTPRFFAFGCEQTRNQTPTWADILGRNYQEMQNWGEPSTNQQIFARVVEAHLKFEFTPVDVIGIMWTKLNVSSLNEVNAIFSAEQMLKNLKCRYFFLLTENTEITEDNVIGKLLPYYTATLHQIKPAMSDIVPKHNSTYTVGNYLTYLDEVIPEEYVDPETREWVQDLDYRLQSGQDYSTIWQPTQIERW